MLLTPAIWPAYRNPVFAWVNQLELALTKTGANLIAGTPAPLKKAELSTYNTLYLELDFFLMLSGSEISCIPTSLGRLPLPGALYVLAAGCTIHHACVKVLPPNQLHSALRLALFIVIFPSVIACTLWLQWSSCLT